VQQIASENLDYKIVPHENIKIKDLVDSTKSNELNKIKPFKKNMTVFERLSKPKKSYGQNSHRERDIEVRTNENYPGDQPFLRESIKADE
jgi:hypothetical protein